MAPLSFALMMSGLVITSTNAFLIPTRVGRGLSSTSASYKKESLTTTMMVPPNDYRTSFGNSAKSMMEKIRGGSAKTRERAAEAEVKVKEVNRRLERALDDDEEPLLQDRDVSGVNRITAVAPREIENFKISDDVFTEPLLENEPNIRAGSAIVGAVLGFAVGGPVLALVAASLTSYSVSARNDAGEAARGSGKWAIDTYNFFARMNKKYTVVQKISNYFLGLYGRFKRDVPDPVILDKVESSAKTTIKVATNISDEIDLPSLVGTALVKTGEFTVNAARTVVDFNKEYKVTDKVLSWLQREVVQPIQRRN